MPPRTLLLVVPLLVLLAGCGGGATTTVTGSAPPVAAAPPAERPAGDGQTPVARRMGSIDDQPLLLELLPLRRHGQVTTLTLRLTLASDTDTDYFVDFDDGVVQERRSTGEDLTNTSMDGITLIDAEHASQYLVARTSDNDCVCDVGADHSFVPRKPEVMSATFGAPPPEVTSVDVRIPGFGTFTDVPLS